MPGIDFIQNLAVILVVAALVGWLCQRIGLSIVVGFLVAGIVVGPHTPPFSLVTDEASIEMAAQVGLVFLMFSVGLKLSIRKLRRLGLSLLIGVFASAGLIYYMTRLAGVVIGFSPIESLFLAGMLMISSSSIIGKVLQEVGATHERAGQLAMGVSVLEDVVAVVMLTVLTSVAQFGGKGGGAHIGQTIGLFGAFVVLAGIAGLLLVPWLLRKMSVAVDDELQTLGMAGLLFGLAILANHAGYSLALGSFLLGTIVAETPHRHQIERTFTGMRDVFSAVFFVAIGMQIDLRVLGAEWALILGVAVFTLVTRTLAVSTGLTLIGTPAKDAFRVGLTTLPIGEFSFVIAQLGITAAVVPPKFYPLAVGVSLMTTLVSPVFTRRSQAISEWVFARQPRWLEAWLAYYSGWLDRVQARQKRNLLWQLSKKRLIQIAVEVMFVTGLLVFSEQLLAAVTEWLGRDWLFPSGPVVIFWVVLGLLVIVPLVAIWRNLSAMALLYAQVSTQGNSRAARLAPLMETGLKTVAAVAIFIWLASFMPTGGSVKWLLLGTVLVTAGAMLLLKRKIIYWHSELEVELQGLLTGGDERLSATAAPWLRPHEDWNLSVGECVLPDLADCQGRRIAELNLRSRFGCTVVGIERQGYMISLPPPDSVLYPRDKLLLMGTTAQLSSGKHFLTGVSGLPPAPSEFDDVRMESLPVPAHSPAAGHTLRELSPAQAHQVQIAGINRQGFRILNPGADEAVRAGDELLTLGTPAQLRAFKIWLAEVPAPIEG
ncbi:MAG TPA: cation:proton antiporter [Rariglobus sp.]|jgi:CPA2 family monovalent cation:H+ antiporter-2|nr:cation:proton antiporter [Rariglobus sp.]